MNDLLEDIVVAKKLVEILNTLYGEGTKSQVEKMLVSDVEDELEERYGKALNDEQYVEQRHRVRDAMIESGILFYDTKMYRLLLENPNQSSFDKIQAIIVKNNSTNTSEKKENTREQNNNAIDIGNTDLVNEVIREFDIASQEEEFKSYVLNLVRNMQPFEFERLTTKLLRACGLEFFTGHRTGDDGVDGYGQLQVAGLFKFKVLVQCKRYQESNKITNYAIRDLRGAVSTDAFKGLFVTTSSFSPRAKQEAEKFPQIDMIDGRQFVDLMIEKKVGIVEINGKYAMEKDYLKHIELEEK